LLELDSVTFEDMHRLAYDTGLYWPQQELPEYASRFEALRTTDPKLAAKVEPYLSHLLDWDCRVTPESTQATLCEAWYEELYGMDYPAETLLPPYADQPERRFEALVAAAEKLQSRHGDWRVPWGELFRAQRQPQLIDLVQIAFNDHKPSLPSLGAPGPLGVVFTQYYAPSMSIPFVMSMNKRYGLVARRPLSRYCGSTIRVRVRADGTLEQIKFRTRTRRPSLSSTPAARPCSTRMRSMRALVTTRPPWLNTPAASARAACWVPPRTIAP
jgi:hypothetical protein